MEKIDEIAMKMIAKWEKKNKTKILPDAYSMPIKTSLDDNQL